jgi:hypothetical protein
MIIAYSPTYVLGPKWTWVSIGPAIAKKLIEIALR